VEVGSVILRSRWALIAPTPSIISSKRLTFAVVVYGAGSVVLNAVRSILRTLNSC
jgi:hypothetical protein